MFLYFPNSTEWSAIAKDQKQDACIKVLGAGIYNATLEDVCKFNGGVKEKLLAMYNEAGCKMIVTQKTVERIAADVLLDTKRRYTAMGHQAFCEGNIDAYNALQEE